MQITRSKKSKFTHEKSLKNFDFRLDFSHFRCILYLVKGKEMLLFRKLGFSDSSGVLSKAGKNSKKSGFRLEKFEFCAIL